MTLLALLALTGALLGEVGARRNRVRTSDERTLWILAGVIGTPLAVAEWWAVVRLVAGAGALPAALVIVAIPGVLGAAMTPRLDSSNSRPAWVLSCLIKGLRSPVASSVGGLAAIVARSRGKPVDFRRGMVFLYAGSGAGALALGGLAWCQGRCFHERCIPDALARHEAVHSRTVAAVGELGFYLTYLTAGAAWARIQGGPWNGLTQQGCGQPFEKTATLCTGDLTAANRCKRNSRRRPADATAGYSSGSIGRPKR